MEVELCGETVDKSGIYDCTYGRQDSMRTGLNGVTELQETNTWVILYYTILYGFNEHPPFG